MNKKMMLILLCTLALLLVVGSILGIIYAVQYSAPWYVTFWSIVAPVCALYFVCKRIISCIKAIKYQNNTDK